MQQKNIQNGFKAKGSWRGESARNNCISPETETWPQARTPNTPTSHSPLISKPCKSTIDRIPADCQPNWLTCFAFHGSYRCNFHKKSIQTRSKALLLQDRRTGNFVHQDLNYIAQCRWVVAHAKCTLFKDCKHCTSNCQPCKATQRNCKQSKAVAAKQCKECKPSRVQCKQREAIDAKPSMQCGEIK